MFNKDRDNAWVDKSFRGIIRFFSWFSLKNQHRIGSVLGMILFWIPNNSRKVVRANLKTAYPHLSVRELKKMSLEALKDNVKIFTELGAVWGWPIERLLPLVRKVHGEELIAQAFEKNRGLIMLTPHFGCWEITSLYVGQNYDLTFLYQPPDVKSIEKFISEVRERAGGRAVPTDIGGVKTMFKALKNNKMVGLLPDQDPGNNGGSHAPFFSYPARTMTLVSKLAARAKCDVLFMTGERLPNGEGFDLHVFPTDAEIASKDELIATSALNRGVEACVAIQPTQYLWTYKRYRHPPEGVVDVYKGLFK